MDIPAHIPVYREPLAPSFSLKTYVLHVSELCQMQWDYILDWPDNEQPKLWICAYRCFQRSDSGEEFQEVDSIPFDVPVWDDVIAGICQDAAGVLYSSARVVGALVPVTSDYKFGAEEAAKKCYDMRKYRTMMQADQKSKSKSKSN